MKSVQIQFSEYMEIMFSRNGSGITGYPYTKGKKNMNFNPYLFTIYKKKILTWITDQTVKTKIIK